ncbi:MAG TPA: ribonuclease III [Gammaproteobacteria bacterium]|nr:ribonuclease III [Gammaproteobacteria bacterium]
MIKSLDQLESHLKLCFHSKDLLKQALTHRSANSRHNERLEFLGDSIVNFVIAEALYHKFPSAKEGELSRMRASLVCQKGLVIVAKRLALGDYIHLGSGELKSGGRQRESILSDTLEALIGALYLDRGMVEAQRQILSWFQHSLDAISIDDCQKDAKTRLQEKLQADKLPLPEYQVVAVSGEDHAQVFTVRIEVENFSPIEVEASSKRRAEQKAAERILEIWLASEQDNGL